jgi:hypothetical protein
MPEKAEEKEAENSEKEADNKKTAENAEILTEKINKLEELIKAMEILTNKGVKTYKTSVSQRRCALAWYNKNKDTMDYKIKYEIKRRARKALLLKQKQEKEKAAQPSAELPNNMPIFLGY